LYLLISLSTAIQTLWISNFTPTYGLKFSGIYSGISISSGISTLAVDDLPISDIFMVPHFFVGVVVGVCVDGM